MLEIPLEQVTDGLSPESVKTWDSLAQLNLIIAVEKEFDIELEIEEIFTIFCVQDLASLLEKRNLM